MVTASSAPSLLRTQPAPRGNPPAAMRSEVQSNPTSLLDCMYDGFCMVFLIKNGHVPHDEASFREGLRHFLLQFERAALRLRAPAEHTYQCKFAFCGLVDELILSSNLPLRQAWERHPLQMELFGEQLAGERFFEQLETLRQTGSQSLQVLEVFHMCLLLGFQGRYALEGPEKLSYLTSRVGEEVALLRGKRAGFAPHWQAPDKIEHQLRSEIPLWVVGSVFALFGLLAFIGLRTFLDHNTQNTLSKYSGVIKLVPDTAHVSINLP